MLIVIGGLPGTGKTTIARELCCILSAAYIRIDAIEQAALKSLPAGTSMGPLGYVVGHAVALSNLMLGATVVADCVNPVFDSRRAWQRLAQEADTPLIEVEISCSDLREHRRRIEERRPDLVGHALPSWKRVQNMTYEPVESSMLRIDTARQETDASLRQILNAISDGKA